MQNNFKANTENLGCTIIKITYVIDSLILFANQIFNAFPVILMLLLSCANIKASDCLINQPSAVQFDKLCINCGKIYCKFIMFHMQLI